MKREYGAEQPGIKMGMFVFRFPFVHYRFEKSEFLQALLMCATCLGAIPVMTENLGIPFDLAWDMVIINGFLYTLHSTWGDPVVPGWITPSIPLTLAFLAGFPIGETRIQALIALQLLVALIFIIMGITGIASKLLGLVPESIKAGILMGAGFAAVIGEVGKGKRFDQTPITIGIGALIAFFLLFSSKFKRLRKKSKFWDTVRGYGMLPAIILAVIIGPIVGEYVIPKVNFWPFIKIPDFSEILYTVSPFFIGWPSAEMFAKAVPMAIVIYIIAFGDFVTSEALLNEADEIRKDEKIVFDANRSNLISGVRNLIEGLFCAYPTLAGPLWAAVTASVAERYKDGPEKMESIFSGVGTFRWSTFLAVAIVPIVGFVQPILPAALSMTLLVQGYICVRLAIDLTISDVDKGIAGVMGAVIASRGAAWGLAIGLILYFLLTEKKGFHQS
ncbi:MAG: hypothetical protein E6746_00105 [Peptoniphilus lacydonensis]|uniref:hypothetical protein n=1 Tax=Peptoniphilus lacydonensis TaxID=1673725 RepID=UPI0028FFEDCB|nr:hypothetical protein [Peptoniphilus lacydonensis]MDU1953947.1 hypothetical protein [Peptoniphilus lacydonensis]MDU5275804.1 hypothetical protein [Peptoniphilus lacydonensis]